MYRCIIFTLFENNYEYGVGALINSVIANKFKGKFIIGYKGKTPFWVNQLTKKNETYTVPNYKDIEIELLEIKSNLHLRYYKPFLFEELLLIYKNHKIFYFDPDITVIADWAFFEEWADCGTPLVMDDCYPTMPSTHPIKQQWAKIFNYDIKKSTNYNFYVNSGFIGVGNASSHNLIKNWKENILLLLEQGQNLSDFKPAIIKYNTHKRLNPITGDQDILNATICQHYEKTTLSIIGPEGMGFIQGSYVMLHNTGSKTWSKNFLLDFIKNGVKISEANYSYIKNSSYPINLYSNQIKRWAIKTNLLATQILQKIF